MMHSLPKKIKIINFIQKNNENYLNIEVEFDNILECLLMPIDKNSELKIHSTMIELHSLIKVGKNPSFYIAGFYNEKKTECSIFGIYIKLVQNKIRFKKKVICSELFYKNMLWLFQAESWEEINNKLIKFY